MVHTTPKHVAQLDLRTLWMSPGNNIRVYIDDDEEGTVLRGTTLPPARGGDEGRRFRSKPGGKVKVLLVTDSPGSLSFFSIAIHTACTDALCGHGSCDAIAGLCLCDNGYGGPTCNLHCPNVVHAWNETKPLVKASTEVDCNVASPTMFEYPRSYELLSLVPTPNFVGSPGVFSFGPIVPPDHISNEKYSSGVLLPDGRVVFVPDSSPSVGLYDPVTNMFSTGPRIAGRYFGGVLLPDGRVVFVPFGSATIGLYDPTINQSSTGPAVPNPIGHAFRGGVLLPDGRVAFVPDGAISMGLYYPITNQFSMGANVGSSDWKYCSGVLLPDGRVVLVPLNNEDVGLYDPVTNKFSTGPSIGSGTGHYSSGVLLPDGRVLFVPLGSTNVGLYNPATNKFSPGSVLPERSSSIEFSGGVLVPDGRVVFVPFRARQLGLYNGTFGRPAYVISGTSQQSWDTLLLPYYNKN